MNELKIPKNWNSKPISEITESYAGGTPRTEVSEYWNGGTIPWIRSGKLKDTIINSSDVFITEKGLKNSSAKLYPPQTVLVAITGATTGKTGLLKIEACGTQNVFGILPCDEILPEYLWYYMRYYYKQLFAKSIGGAQGHVNGTIIKNTMINYPKDKKTQQKIVLKLDYVLGSFAEKKKKILEFTNYKKLVNPKPILIQSTYDRLIDFLKNKSCNKNTLGSFTIRSQNGMTGRPSNSPPGTPRLGITSITQSKNDFVDENESKYIQVSKNDIRSYQICKGDLLVCRQNGNKNFVGKFAMYAGQTNPLIFSDSLIRFQIDSTKVEPEYLVMFMNSSGGRKLIEPYCQTTAGNYSLNGTNLKNIEVIYPSIEIQKKIIVIKNKEFAQMNIIMDKIDKVFFIKNNIINSINHLSNSILDKAFSGKLIN